MKKQPRKKAVNTKPVQPHQPESRFTVTINGRTLGGVKDNGRWAFTCPPWPELAAEHNGEASAEGMVAAFTVLALAGSVTGYLSVGGG